MDEGQKRVLDAAEPRVCECADAVSLRRELTTIFGVPIVRDGETWNAAMLRQIGGFLTHNHRQAKYIKALYEDIATPLDLLVKELGGE